MKPKQTREHRPKGEIQRELYADITLSEIRSICSKATVVELLIYIRGRQRATRGAIFPSNTSIAQDLGLYRKHRSTGELIPDAEKVRANLHKLKKASLIEVWQKKGRRFINAYPSFEGVEQCEGEHEFEDSSPVVARTTQGENEDPPCYEQAHPVVLATII